MFCKEAMKRNKFYRATERVRKKNDKHFLPYSIPPNKKNNPTQTRVDLFFVSGFMSTKMQCKSLKNSLHKSNLYGRQRSHLIGGKHNRELYLEFKMATIRVEDSGGRHVAVEL